ncbi:MAG: phosphatidylserine decarboxylase [Gammaproteobacteria bacterium]|jgi:phosphatidylserine decarboxylase
MLPIAPEGRLLLLTAAALAAVVHYFFGAAVAAPFWGLTVLVLIMFRIVPRHVQASPLGIVSPVDGHVTAVHRQTDPFLKRDSLVIELEQRLLGEFNIHSPTEGRVMDVWYPGANPEQPGRFAVRVQTDEGDDVVVAIGVGGWTSVVHCSLQTGHRIGQGHRCGFAGFLRPVTIYLPANSQPQVQAADRVRWGRSVLALLRHE